MSLGTKFFAATMSLGMLVLSACSTESMREAAYNKSDSFELDSRAAADHAIRHTIREVAEYDTLKMIALMNKEFDSRITDEQKYFNHAVIVLGQTILVQPHFAEREATLREFKSKIDQSQFLEVLPQTLEQLISISASANPADQATAMFALTNLAIEIRTLIPREKESRDELMALLYRLRDAHLKISQRAQRYASEQVSALISPSEEAAATLKSLEKQKI